MTRFFYARADAVVVTSQGVADDLVANYGVPRSKIRVLHNPVDLDAIVAAAAEPIGAAISRSDRPVVAAAGRLAGVKNYPLLIDAIAELVAEDAGPCVDSRRRCRAGAARAAGARARRSDRLVRFLGFQQNPWRFIARADVFVLTSTYEGFGNVLIEAMACGTPVVATRSPGTVEIIEHGANGLLVDHEPHAVAGAIATLLADRPLRDRLVARARESVSALRVPARSRALRSTVPGAGGVMADRLRAGGLAAAAGLLLGLRLHAVAADGGVAAAVLLADGGVGEP